MPWRQGMCLATALAAFAIPAQAAGDEIKTLCFFSLNNEMEYELTADFLEQSGSRVRSIEFHQPAREDRPELSFRHMISSRAPCDGLVISGHHTGSFGGNRARGVLTIDLLEELSCDADYEAFFRRVNAVWLQGCRTLGVGSLGEEGNELRADYHMQRVGAELAQDGLQQSFTDLSLEFSATLDQDNPLASRYQRVFPSATLFGWTRSSPGVLAGSEKSLLYHMSHMAQLSQGAPLFNPFRPPSRALRSGMTQGMWRTLDGDRSHKALAGKAWLSHGQVNQSGLGFQNPDLNVYPPLLESSRSDLLQARALACDLRNAGDSEQFRRVLAAILADPDYIAYNLNAIRATFGRYQSKDPATYARLRKELAQNPALMQLLQDKLRSPRTGLLMKIEYYSFYRELTGHTSAEVEKLILQHVRHFLLARDLAGSAYDIRDFRESLLVSVASHDLADTDYYLGLIHAPRTSEGTLAALTWSFVRQAPPGAETLVGEIIRHPAAGSDALRGAALWILTAHPAGTGELLGEMLVNPALDEATLETLTAVLVKYRLSNGADLAASIVAHPNTNRLALGRTSLAIRRHDMSVGPSLLQDIVAHHHVDARTLENVAAARLNPPAPAPPAGSRTPAQSPPPHR